MAGPGRVSGAEAEVERHDGARNGSDAEGENLRHRGGKPMTAEQTPCTAGSGSFVQVFRDSEILLYSNANLR